LDQSSCHSEAPPNREKKEPAERRTQGGKVLSHSFSQRGTVRAVAILVKFTVICEVRGNMRPAKVITENEFLLLEYFGLPRFDPAHDEILLAERKKTRYAAFGRAKTSRAYKISPDLERRNLIASIPTGTWRTRKIRREYELTFVGCVVYLAEAHRRYRRPSARRNIVVELTSRYGELLRYSPFSEFGSIEAALGEKEAAETFLRDSQSMFSAPPNAPWNFVTMKHPLRDRLVQSDTGAFKDAKKVQEDVWKDEFALRLLPSISGLRGPIESQPLKEYYDLLLAKQVKAAKDNLKGWLNSYARLRTTFREPLEKTETD
jgi:hypothetical protein